MKNLRTKIAAVAIAIVALAAIACVASAQSPVTGRSFSYKASDAINQDYSTAGNVTLKSATNVTVDPYLYITGNLSANWVVDGWGVGSDSQTNSINVWVMIAAAASMRMSSGKASANGRTTSELRVALLKVTERAVAAGIMTWIIIFIVLSVLMFAPFLQGRELLQFIILHYFLCSFLLC